MASSTLKRLRPDSDDDEHEASTIFTSQENFARYLIIESKNKEKPVTSLSPFVIEKQIESMIGTAKSVKKLKNGTLLVETTRKTQTENLKKQTSFFGVPVEVTEHQSLNSSKGIIRNPILRAETEENILEYLKPQGVTHVKRFTIRKNNERINTNTLLLTFNSVATPKTLIFSTNLFKLNCMFLTLSGVLTAKSLATTRTTAPLTRVQCVKSVAQVITTILPVNAKSQQSVSIAAKITCPDQVTVMFGKRRKRS